MQVFISDKEVRRGAPTEGLTRLRREPRHAGGGWMYVPHWCWPAYRLKERAIDLKYFIYERMWWWGLLEPSEALVSSWRDISPFPWRGLRRERDQF